MQHKSFIEVGSLFSNQLRWQILRANTTPAITLERNGQLTSPRLGVFGFLPCHDEYVPAAPSIRGVQIMHLSCKYEDHRREIEILGT